MKETKCDYCGKVIDGNYPDEDITESARMYNFNSVVPGQIKQEVYCTLSVDCKFGWESVEYHFCSVDCLKKHIDAIDNAIECMR